MALKAPEATVLVGVGTANATSPGFARTVWTVS